MATNLDTAQRNAKLLQRPIDGRVLKRLVKAALTWLRTNQEIVNALNVFPVPDGDTGTNMVLTMQAAYDEIKDLPERNFGKVAQSVAHGALMGARGNSGVILSQLWRGFARKVDEVEVLHADIMVQGLAEARDTAYKGVVRPVEGTILTVGKDIAFAAEEALIKSDDPISILEEVVKAAEKSVEHTPELLNILKEAGVVDAGGQGLFVILEGMLRYINGEALDIALASVVPIADMILENTYGTIESGQDYEVIVDFSPTEPLDLVGFYADLEQMGTSIQVGEGDGVYRMHIHVPTDDLYTPIDYTRSLGTISKVAIENLMEQMQEQLSGSGGDQIQISSIEPGQIAVVAVAPGKGIAQIFASMKAAAIVEGGQTMNPSTQEIVASFENIPSDKIIILPNNKNIFMAAKSAAEVTDKNVAVIPSRTVPQGFSAMIRWIPEGDFDNVVKNMTEAVEDVVTGEITVSTRDVEIDGVEAHQDDIIALLNGKMVLSADSIEKACMGFLEKAEADQFEIMTLYYGAELDKAKAELIGETIVDSYPDLELEVHEGGQPHYHFIISIE